MAKNTIPKRASSSRDVLEQEREAEKFRRIVKSAPYHINTKGINHESLY